MSRVRITSDGSDIGTSITVDGKPLGGVLSAVWSCKVGELAVATITLEAVEVEVVGDDAIDPRQTTLLDVDDLGVCPSCNHGADVRVVEGHRLKCLACAARWQGVRRAAS